jgi:O-methyltransferase
MCLIQGISSLKTVLKKSGTVHSAYKLIRDAGSVPTKKWLRLDQMSMVFKVLPNTMLPMRRLFDALEAINTINQEDIAGDVVECGVWNGGCVGLMALANSTASGRKRTFHLFDSFEGLPQPSAHDIDVIASFKAKHPELGLQGESQGSRLQPIGSCVGNSHPLVEEFLVQCLGINRKDLTFHVGWFQDTIPRSGNTIRDIALLRIDGDWYDSTKTCLEGLYDQVVKDGFIIIDDYGTFSGCREATDEFFGKRDIKYDASYSDSCCMFFRKK